MNHTEVQIKKNVSLLANVLLLGSKVNISDSNMRDMLLAGFFRNCLTHFEAMNVLIEKKLYNSAFALVRVFFETIVRARYMHTHFDDEEIGKLYVSEDWDKFFNCRKPTIVNLDTMCQALDNHYGLPLFMDIKSRTYKRMNDYTHTGANQIASNFNLTASKIEPNFSPELIVDTLIGNYTLMKSFAILFLGIGLKQGEITEQEIEDYQVKNK